MTKELKRHNRKYLFNTKELSNRETEVGKRHDIENK